MAENIKTPQEVKTAFDEYRKQLLNITEEAKSRLEKEIKLLQGQIEEVSVINKQTAIFIKKRKVLQDLLKEFVENIDTVAAANIRLAQECCEFYPNVASILDFAKSTNLWDKDQDVRAERIKDSENVVRKYLSAFDEIIAAGKPSLEKQISGMENVMKTIRENW
jgi:uncharacterized protein YoxC